MNQDDFEKPIAYEAYQKLADSYAEKIDTKPHNAFYDRPAVISLWPELKGCKVLDAGCGPGAYSQLLAEQGATVVGCDMCDRMLELAMERISTANLSDQVTLVKADLDKPLTMLEGQQFELVNAALCLDYIEDWTALFKEFFRVLKPGGWLVYSVGHPSFDAGYFNTTEYFSVERVEATWTGFDEEILMPSFRRSLGHAINPVCEAGFRLDRLLEPLPTEDFKKTDLRRYLKLIHRPCFMTERAQKPL